jgi:RNA polymerase sigma-70 factor, ECF subfamily
MNEEDDDLDELARACRNGNAAAMEALLARVRPSVLRYLFAQGLQRADVEDVAQEVCMAVAQTVPQWQERGSSVWAFVFTVLRRRLADRARAQVRSAQLQPDPPEIPDPRSGPEDMIVHRDGLGELREHLDALPQRQREVLLLRVVVGLTVAETAQAVGLAHGSVHVLQHRAVRALRARLGDRVATA